MWEISPRQSMHNVSLYLQPLIIFQVKKISLQFCHTVTKNPIFDFSRSFGSQASNHSQLLFLVKVIFVAFCFFTEETSWRHFSAIFKKAFSLFMGRHFPSQFYGRIGSRSISNENFWKCIEEKPSCYLLTPSSYWGLLTSRPNRLHIIKEIATLHFSMRFSKSNSERTDKRRWQLVLGCKLFFLDNCPFWGVFPPFSFFFEKENQENQVSYWLLTFWVS